MIRTYGRNTNQTRLTLGESKRLRKLAQNVDTLAQLTDSTVLDEKQFQDVLFELGLDLTKMLTLLENKIDGQKLSVAKVSNAYLDSPDEGIKIGGLHSHYNSFEWVELDHPYQHIKVSEIEFDTENGNSY